jgi:hypothetical protein
MQRSILGGLVAALLVGVVLGGVTRAVEPNPATDDPGPLTDGSLVLTGVIVDPAATTHRFFASVASPSGQIPLGSGTFDVGPDGSFAIALAAPDTTGEISVLIVEAADPATSTVDEHGCTEERVRGTRLRFDSAEAIAAGPITVRLTETYAQGLCPPATWAPGGGQGSTAGADTAGAVSASPPAAEAPAPDTVGGIGGAPVTPPPTEAAGSTEPLGGSPLSWLITLGAAGAVLAGLLWRTARVGGGSG